MTSTPFLTAEWRNLVMMNYEVDPEILQSRVPAGTELDLWNGHCYASIVGFLFQKTKVLGLPIPFHVNFEEVNLRFYVRRKSEGDWRRGVVFIKEIVPRWAIAAVARVLYNENYVSLAMKHTIQKDSVEYMWRAKERWNSLKLQAPGAVRSMAGGSHEEFIAEHYWGYTAQKDGGTMEYRVEHPPWRVRDGSDPKLDSDVAELYGSEWESILRAKPVSAFVAEGSPIAVYQGHRLIL